MDKTLIGKGRYALYETEDGQGVLSYRPDGDKEDSHHVIPAKFWGIISKLMRGEDVGPMGVVMKRMAGR